MQLILGLIWILLALYLFFIQSDHAERLGLPLSLGWLALLFGLYRLVRWWGEYMGRPKQDSASHWKRPPVRRPSDHVGEPDPNFVFDEDPPPGAEPPTNGPAETKPRF